MKRFVLGVAAALLLSAGPAAADGLPTSGSIKDTGVSIAPTWSGFYVGVGVGAGAVVHDIGINDGDYQFLGFDGIGAEGVFGTASVGYDRQIHPKWVAGIFADYDFGSSISTDLSIHGDNVFSVDQNYTWAVGGRLGYLVNPSTLLYGTAGYTETEFEASLSGERQSLGSASHTFGGYFVGAGLETMLRPQWSLKLEYRFSQFDDDVVLGDPDCYNLSVEPSEQTARLVLSYKFGRHD